ncbi:copper homeostasis periplasmic binding protein CopC [Massilia litorea]|jgi:methionine-rich copper-binding protein CopC|uniref:Copper homeostasis periplasmic binding protein CopC n=1 Tax=Massilia litorea TaxID=2769491 RepID=A0A7L9U228_9BURK|nr:copper homeostasis periplasmic binding protein CopC [Massilia litorea]QOL48947.1 copper homeostasis periplasmic binding protein CopC [Massilia litorea]
MKTNKLAAAALATLACAFASQAWAHAKLQASTPKADSVVSAAPAQLRLQFNEPLELPFSKVKLVDDKGVELQPSKIAVDAADPKTLVGVLPALHPGAWRVQWTTVTRDGHKVKGEFGFRVK